MGGKTSNHRSRNNNKKKHNNNKKNKKMAPPLKRVEDIVAAGDAAISIDSDVSKALLLYKSAEATLSNKKNNYDLASDIVIELRRIILEKTGSALVSMGDPTGALEHYQKSLILVRGQLEREKDDDDKKEEATVHREICADLCFTIGQLSCENDALEAYRNGISDLEQTMQIRRQQFDNDNNKKAGTILDESRRKLATACSTVAELYLTDLCFEEHAEQECESYVQRSLEIIENCAPYPPDPYQIAASLKLSQNEIREATQHVLRAYETMKVGCEALSKLVGLATNNNNEDDDRSSSNNKNDAKELVHVEEAENLPTFEFRTQTAKLLLECGCAVSTAEEEQETTTKQKNECFRACLNVLGSLLAENDEVAEIYYLIGCVYCATNQTELSRHYLERTHEMLSKIKEALLSSPDDEMIMEEDDNNNNNTDNDDNTIIQEQLNDVQIQLEEVQFKLAELNGEIPKKEAAMEE